MITSHEQILGKILTGKSKIKKTWMNLANFFGLLIKSKEIS